MVALREEIAGLTRQLRVLTDVLDEVREEFSWVTRNGVPVQPIEHVIVKRMALDPCAVDWGERLELERYTLPQGRSRSAIDPEQWELIAQELSTTLEAVAQGQLEVVLMALDGVRREIVTMLKCRDAGQTPARGSAPAESQPESHPEPPASPASPGRLF